MMAERERGDEWSERDCITCSDAMNCFVIFYNDLDSRLRGNDIVLVDCFVLIIYLDYDTRVTEARN